MKYVYILQSLATGHFDVVTPTTAAWKIVAATVAREIAALR